MQPRILLGPAVLLAAALISAGAARAVFEEAAHHAKVDLLEISRRLDMRYRWAETGELPAGYILIGDPQGARFLRPGPLHMPADTRRRLVEYDPLTRSVFTFRVPGLEPFLRQEEREGVYFVTTPRGFDLEGFEIGVSSIDAIAEDIRLRSSRRVWLEELSHALARETGEVRARGKLIDIRIPISLPRQLEAIFGRGEETRLTVSGRERITIGGTSRWCANCPLTEGMPKQQKFPDLDMQQQLTVNLHGTIGEKINVAIDHSSMGGGMPSVNRVRLNYTGFDDDIIKRVEMGDTDMTLSGAQLISHSGQAKGLFGIKTVAQIGPLDLTVVASKEEGESATGTFSSTGGQATERVINDYDYIKRQFFYFETPGDDFSAPRPGFGQYFPVIGGDDSLEVFVSFRADLQWRDITRRKIYVHAWTDPHNDGKFTGGDEFRQWFYPIYEGVDYDLIQDYGADEASPRYIGLRLRRSLGAEQALAIRYRLNRLSETVEVGDYKTWPAPFEGDQAPIEPDRYITAELICPPEDEFAPPGTEGAKYTSTWNMMFRNVYSLGIGSLDDAMLDVKIRAVGTIRGTAEIHERTGERYLRIFGLDRYQGTGAWGADGFVDVRQGVINFFHGYIMFPSPRPFDPTRQELRAIYDTQGPPAVITPSDSVDRFVDSLHVTLQRNPAIYDEILARHNPPNYYEIVIESSTGSRVFKLGAFDILEGTESVTVDGTRLSRGVDYDIDYFGGVVTLKGEYANLPPDASVRIDYQHRPLFGGGRSTLIGVGGSMNPSRNSRLNATFLYNSVGAPKYTPRLGEEPTRMMAANINGSLQFSPRWITSVVNLLPRVSTTAGSSVSLAGEVAASFPNPNTMGEVFVDDMEGIEDSSQLQLVRSLWYEASPPLDPLRPDTTLPAWPDGIAGDEMEFYWYNPANTNRQQMLTTSRKDLNPKLDDRENSRLTSMFLKAIRPRMNQWAGVMTGFAGGLDLSTAQYLEIWVNDYTPDPDLRRGILRIDFGRIDENFHQPHLNRFDAENLTTWTVADDRGFPGDHPDRRFNAEFTDRYWDPERRIYRWINSRIGNSRPDSEDLNRNGRLDRANEYYSLRIDLADSALIDVQRDFANVSSYWNDAEKGWINRRKSWRMYRVDITSAELPAGLASRLDRVQHMRIWIENIDEISAVSDDPARPEHMLEITGLKFVGSRWEFNHIRDLADEEKPVSAPEGMKVTIGAINNKDNPSIYSSPRPVDKEDGIEIREQSLLFDVENFETGYSFRAMKRFFGQGADFNQYREIQFFIRPDNRLVGGINEGLEFFFQVAHDSLNYYEVAVPIHEGDRDRWRWINVLLSDLTNLKLGAAPGQTVEREISDAENPAHRYRARLVGDPTLFRVRFLFAGLRNRTGTRIAQGQIWFNDIALGSVKKDIDHAERLSGSVSLANVASINANYQRTGPEFRSLRQKSGSGSTDNAWALSGKTEINHFIPTAGFALPVSARYNAARSEPKYIPQSDVEIMDRRERELRRTERNSYAYSVSISRSGSRNFIMKNLFDNFRAGYNYSRNQAFSPTALDTSWSQSWNTSYQIQFRKERRLRLPRGISLSYWPTNFSANASGAKSVRTRYSLAGGRFVKSPVGVSHGWDNEMRMSYDPFESVRMNFRRSEKRDMMAYREAYGVPIGRLMNYRQGVEMQYQPRGHVRLISQFNPRFEYSARYEEDLNPSVRRQDDPEETRNVSNSRSMNIVFDVNVGQYAYAVGKRTGIIPADERTTAAAYAEQRSRMHQRVEDFRQRVQTQPQPQQTPRERDLDARIRDDLDLSLDDFDLELDPAAPEPPPDLDERLDPEERRPAGTYSDLLTRRPRATVETRVDTLETREAPADTAAPSGWGDPLYPLRQVVRLLGKTKPVRSSIRIDDNSMYQRLYERADWKYRYGLTEESGVIGSSCGDLICEPENVPLRASHRVTYDLRTSVDLTTNLSADVRFNLGFRRDEADMRVTKIQDVTWPDVALNIRGLESWGPLEKYVSRSNMNIIYRRSTSISSGSERNSVAVSPTWNLTWKNTLATNLSFSYNNQQRIERRQESWNRSYAMNLELRYDIRGAQGFGLPLLGGRKISFESTLTTALNINYLVNDSHNTPAASVMSIAPRCSYTFSRNVSGSLTASYRRSSGGIYGYIFHEIGLHATAEFKF